MSAVPATAATAAATAMWGAVSVQSATAHAAATGSGASCAPVENTTASSGAATAASAMRLPGAAVSAAATVSGVSAGAVPDGRLFPITAAIYGQRFRRQRSVYEHYSRTI